MFLKKIHSNQKKSETIAMYLKKKFFCLDT